MKLIKHDSFFNDPWTDLDRLFESTFPELYQWSPLRQTGRDRSLPLDVYEDEDNRYVRMEIPGVAKGDIEIELENAVLSVRAKREEKAGEESTTINLNRSVTVGDDVNPEHVKASLDNGMLTIELPKREQAKPKQITIA